MNAAYEWEKLVEIPSSYISSEIDSDAFSFEEMSAAMENGVSDSAETSNTIEATCTQLEAMYGDRIFNYKTYSGTVTYLYSVCPAFPEVLAQGLDYAINWLESNNEMPEDKPEINDRPVDENLDTESEPGEQEKANETEVQSSAEYAPSDETSVDVEATAVSHSVDDNSIEVIESRSLAKNHVEAAIVKPTQAAVKNVKKDLHAASDSITNTDSIHTDEHVVELHVEPIRVVEVIADEEHTDDIKEKVEIYVEPLHEAVTVPDSLPEIVPALVHEAMVDQPDDQANTTNEMMPIVADHKDILDSTPIAEGMIESIKFDEAVEQDVIIYPPLNSFEVSDEKRVEEDVNTDVEQLVPDEDLIGSTELIDVSAPDVEDDPAAGSAIEMLNLHETETEVPSESHVASVIEHGIAIGNSVETDAATQDIVELIFEITAVVPDSYPETIPAETTVQIRTIMQSIQKLEVARTAEECHEALTEIQHELAGLLKLLGYDNVDAIAERLIKQYDIATLKRYLAQLTRLLELRQSAPSLARYIRQEPSHRMFGIHAVGKVVLLGSRPSQFAA